MASFGFAFFHVSINTHMQVRLQMIARNKLVIVRDADETLRIPLSKRLKVKLTQQMSDQVEGFGVFCPHD